MSIALMTALLLAPLPQSMASEPFVSPPPPISGRDGVGDDIRAHLYRLGLEVAMAEARGELNSAEARRLNGGVERIRRQMVRMGNVVGHRQRVRLRARIDALRAQFMDSRA